MGSRNEDVDALVGYIQQLELSLAKKDELLAAKDKRIESLEAVSAPLRNERKPGTPSTPNQVSDESGEIDPESDGSLSHNLSHISRANSSDEDLAIDYEVEPLDQTIDYEVSDGRWNIPFDASFEGLTASSPVGKRGIKSALKESTGFVPICDMEGRVRHSSGTEVALLRPVARRSHGASPFASRKVILRGSLSDKENISPKLERSVFRGIASSPIR